MFATFLIGLREGLEAALVVSILVAFLVKSGQSRYLKYVWTGVAVAVGLTVVVWAVQEYGSYALTQDGQELFEAITSVIAVAFVTWMIFWMRSAARRIGGELRAKLEDAIKLGPIAVVIMAFLAVMREGLETAIMIQSAAQFSEGSGPLWAALGGIATAIAIGVGLYFGAVSINLGRFFTWTGVLLIFVAAGILKYGIYDFQEADVLPGLSDHAFDISGWYAQDAWYGELLGGMFNITARPTVLSAIAWAAYAVPALVLFLWPASRKPKTSQETPKSEESTSAISSS